MSPQVSPATPLSAAPASPVGAASQTNSRGPRVQFDATVFDFGRVMAGEQVNHTFYFTNTGNEDLVLGNVNAGCSCTVVGDWTHQVKPGNLGQIPIAFNSSAYNAPVNKLITVVCNDTNQRRGIFSLQLKGVCWKPIEVIPPAASLLLKPDAPYASATLRITNRLEQVLVLSTPQSSNPLFGAELRTNTFGRGYEVVISNTAAIPPGNVQSHISLKTSITNIPVIDITAWASSQPPLNVVPGRLDLRQAPLATNQLTYVTIINNSTNPITVSEPAVSVAGVNLKVIESQPGYMFQGRLGVSDKALSAGEKPAEVSSKTVAVAITETRPGSYFSILLGFPGGFELPPGQPATFTIKTTHPQVPLVKVPIYQAARSTRPPVVLKRPSPPVAGMATVASHPFRAAPATPSSTGTSPQNPSAAPASSTGTASATNRPPPPPPPTFP